MSDMSPNQIADHLAKILAKPLPAVKKHKKLKGAPPRGKRPTKMKGIPGPTKIPDTQTIRLFGLHRINGFPYGPGTVTVPYELGNVLREMDQRAKTYDDTWQLPKAVIIGPQGHKGQGHMTRRVTPSLFDSPTLNVPEAGFAHSSGEFSDPF